MRALRDIGMLSRAISLVRCGRCGAGVPVGDARWAPRRCPTFRGRGMCTRCGATVRLTLATPEWGYARYKGRLVLLCEERPYWPRGKGRTHPTGGALWIVRGLEGR